MSPDALVPFHSATRNDLVEALVQQFLRTWESEHTRGAYRVDLRLWTQWCLARELDVLNVNKGAVMAFLADRRELGDAESTRARRVAGISSWYSYLMAIDKVENNPANLPRSNRPKVVKGESNTLALSDKQTEELIAAADQDSLRSSALMALLIVSGARISEVLEADVEDITQQDGDNVLPIVGKGRRSRTLVLPPAVYRRLMAYLESRPEVWQRLPALAAGTRPRRPLFITNSGVRMNRRQAHRDIRRLGKQSPALAHLVDRLSPHVTRHSYVTASLKDGVPLRDVQYAVGHASPETTERYDHSGLNPDNHPSYRRAAKLRWA